MTQVISEEQTPVVEIGDGVDVFWDAKCLYIQTMADSVMLTTEEVQNLMNYLEGKRPKMVWE